ncbi:MAG: hypothetical protein AAF602_26810 [Myxococcota bacterium]
MLFVLTLLVPAFAQDVEKPEPKVVYEKETVIDIDDGLEIDAKVAKAEIGIVVVPTPPRGRTLVHLRQDFDKEMKDTVDAVK